MDLCKREKLHQVDLLSPAKQKISDREYRATQRGQEKLDARNREILDAGATPRQTKFQAQKQALRDAISECVNESTSYSQFRSLLFSRYQIKVRESRCRISYLLPDREKPVRGRALGAVYEKEAILQRLEQNLADWSERNNHIIHQAPAENENAAGNSTELAASQDIGLKDNQTEDPFAGYDVDTNPILGVLFIHSDLKLVTNLQTCIKAQVSRAYKQKVQLSNLQMLAHTVAFVQETISERQKNLIKNGRVPQNSLYRLKTLYDQQRKN